MRLVVQRVQRASVTGGSLVEAAIKCIHSAPPVDGQVVSSIGRGLCVLVGLHVKDTPELIQKISRKLLSARLFSDAQDKPWSRNVQQEELEVLCVSQFTLYGSLEKGNKPDFHNSMKTEDAKQFYEQFLNALKCAYAPDKIKDGVFGTMMQVELVNDGPVTVIIDRDMPASE